MLGRLLEDLLLALAARFHRAAREQLAASKNLGHGDPPRTLFGSGHGEHLLARELHGVRLARVLLRLRHQHVLVARPHDGAARTADDLRHEASPSHAILPRVPCQEVAVTLAKPWKSPLRLYLTGRLGAELGASRFDERRLPGRQGRRALVYLALERT